MFTSYAIRITRVPHHQLPLTPFDSHPCITTRNNSRRITSLRKNTPRARTGVLHRLCQSSLQVFWNDTLSNQCENKQLQIEQNEYLHETWGDTNLRHPTFQTCQPSNGSAPSVFRCVFDMYNDPTSGRHVTTGENMSTPAPGAKPSPEK